MTELGFSVAGAVVDRYAASPRIDLQLRVTESSGAKVDAIALRAQVNIEVQRRRYVPEESRLLEELFGDPSRYGDTLKPMLWTHASVVVMSFENEIEIALPIPCSYDFEVAAHKYLASLRDGVVPLVLLFSGMLFVEGANGVTPELIPWSCEARFGLPVAVWREAVDAFFPHSAWIRVDRDVFDELRRFKSAAGLPTWDAALERLCSLAKVRP